MRKEGLHMLYHMLILNGFIMIHDIQPDIVPYSLTFL